LLEKKFEDTLLVSDKISTPFADDLQFFIANLIETTSVEDAFMKVISRLPFFIPAVRLAISARKL
jgi:hypothetical protein